MTDETGNGAKQFVLLLVITGVAIVAAFSLLGKRDV